MEIYVMILAALVAALSGITFFTLHEMERIRKETEVKKNDLSDAEIDQLRQVVAIMSYMGDAHEDKNKS